MKTSPMMIEAALRGGLVVRLVSSRGVITAQQTRVDRTDVTFEQWNLPMIRRGRPPLIIYDDASEPPEVSQ